LKPKWIALNLLLIAALGAVIWQARVRWQEAKEKRASSVGVKVKPAPVPPVSPAPRPAGATATSYADVATKNLFAKDRNPNVIIDPPKVDPPKKMPPLPVVFGVMGLPAGTRAIMAEKPGLNSVPVRAGDTIGEFKIAALDPQNVTFDWDGAKITKKIDDLIDRSVAVTPGAGAGPAVAAPAASAPAPPKPSTVAAGPGTEIPSGGGSPPTRTCVPGDNSPANTVVDGYRKNLIPTPFGNMCNWVKVQ
jgi:hypothetical protein